MKDGLIQVHDIHAALPDGKVLFSNENMVTVEEHGELVVGVGERYLYALHLFFHNVPPCTRSRIGIYLNALKSIEVVLWVCYPHRTR